MVGGRPVGGTVRLQCPLHFPFAQPLVPLVHVPVGPVEPDQAAEFSNRLGVVLHPQVHHRIGPGAACGDGLHDQDTGALLAANIAAGGLPGLQRGQQPLREIAGRRPIRLGHRRPDLRPQHHVGLDGEALADLMPGLRDTPLAGVDGDPSPGIHHRDLPEIAAVVGGQEGRQGLGGRVARPHPGQPQGAVADVHQRLGGDGAHPGLRPRYHRPDGEPVGLHRHPQLSGLGITGDNGECTGKGESHRASFESRPSSRNPVAGHQMAVSDIHQSGFFGRAERQGLGTTGVEGTTRRGVERAGDAPLEDDPRPPGLRVRDWSAGDQRLGVRVAGIVEDALRRADLHRKQGSLDK